MQNSSNQNYEKKQLLAIDCGTQSIRALVFDISGTLIAKSQVSIDQYLQVKEGWFEQHANYFFDSLCRVCHKLWDESNIRPENISGLSITTQRATVVCLDSNGDPVRPAIVWMDQRQASRLPKLKAWWKLAFKITGVDNTVAQFITNTEVNWLKQFEPENIQKTKHYLLLSGYYNYRLTGKYKDSIGNQVGYIPFDYKRHQWAKPFDWKWQACPIEKECLPELVKVGETIGHITQSAHQQTGIPEGLPVIASAADKACETLGCGAIQPNQGQISYGTTATFNTVHSSYIEPLRYLPPYPAAMPDRFTCEYQIYRGYWMVNWFKEQFAHKEKLQANEVGTSTESLLDEQAKSIKPGAEGLILQPFWSPGVRYPGPEARGAIVGFNDTHTKAHIYRALLEGIALGLYEGKEKMQKRGHSKINELYLSGGGSQSECARQITADIFNLPVKLPKTHETSGLGAAICIAVNQGFYKDYESAVEGMCHIEKTVDPIPENVQFYAKLYKDIYRKLYNRLSPLYKTIAELV
ncbi:FGGY-family carbohydrate kinase [Pleionea sediminis]|uniref:FGGY-family carbohydrate kinase n=1 Tax=Pleionea sediminis TaxID=2569479 RepID=UPI0011870C33|nr:FGGY-family carbohydrate kinase [Pleionea sediminis]